MRKIKDSRHHNEEYRNSRNSETTRRLPYRRSTANILAGIIQRHARPPNTSSSSDSSDTVVTTKELYRVANGGDDNGGGGGNGPEGDAHGDINNMGGDNYGQHTKRHEFMLVKASNITVTTFIGTNLTTNPCLQFYKVMRSLIYSQGVDGDVLLELLTTIEKSGANTFTNTQLKEMIQEFPKMA